MAFRTAFRTGDFMLRLAAIRRIAPIFHITGKDRHQFLVADHLAEMARMSESDMKVMCELFSVSLSDDAWARLALDEREGGVEGSDEEASLRYTPEDGFHCPAKRVGHLRVRASFPADRNPFFCFFRRTRTSTRHQTPRQCNIRRCTSTTGTVGLHNKVSS